MLMGLAVLTPVNQPPAMLYSFAAILSLGHQNRAVAHGIAKACRLHQLLHELHQPLSRSTLVYRDNVSAL